jgi:pyridoxamine 5'-phosphate oxidase
MPDPTPNVPGELRREYTREPLLEADVAADAIEQFGRWFAEAQLHQVPESNAMTLATADSSGIPSARVVLLKGFDEKGFTFYTNYTSRKGRELEANPRAALVFYWEPLERQVRIEGTVEKVDRAESEAYFRIRPRGAQIGAWVSQQSEALESREELDRRASQLEASFRDQPVPLPQYWGGYRLVPTAIEFWQGRPSRLHDRLQYLRRDDAAGGGWTLRRLSP